MLGRTGAGKRSALCATLGLQDSEQGTDAPGPLECCKHRGEAAGRQVSESVQSCVCAAFLSQGRVVQRMLEKPEKDSLKQAEGRSEMHTGGREVGQSVS